MAEAGDTGQTGGGEGFGDELRALSARWLYGFVVLGFFAAFLVSVRAVLTPLVLLILFLYVVWPLSGTRVHVRLVSVVSVLALIWVLETTGFLLAPFILALIFSYILDPLVEWLGRHRIPRTAAIALLALPLVGVLVLLILVVVPAVVHQIGQIVAKVPEYVGSLEGWLNRLRAWVIGLGIPGLDDKSVPRLRAFDAQSVGQYLEMRQAELAERGVRTALGLGRGIRSVLAAVGYLVLTPILTVYLLRDWNRILNRITDLVPHSARAGVLRFTREYDNLLGRYLRGQLLLSLLVGLFIGIFLRLLHFPYALLIGLIAGVLNIVPYLGFVVSIVASLLVALFSGAIVASLGKVAVVFVAEQVFENALQPFIVGRSVNLHPVWLMLALALFSFFFGFVGLLIAVPAAVLIKLVVERALSRYRASSYYLQRSGS